MNDNPATNASGADALEPTAPETESMFDYKIRIYREEKAAEEAAKRKQEEDWADLIPEVDISMDRPLTDYENAVNDACWTVTFKEVYSRIPGHYFKPGGETAKGEGIKISCPQPHHPDKRPSCWLNTERLSSKGEPGGQAKCGACEEGWDKYGVARILYGLEPQSHFGELKERIAADFRGIHRAAFDRIGPPDAVPERAVADPSTDSATDGPDDDDAPRDYVGPTYDWREIMAISPVHSSGVATFFSTFCEEAAKDTTPVELNLFYAMLGAGLVAGNNISFDDVKPVTCVFGICSVAHSGAGKSRASNHILDRIRNPTGGAMGHGLGVDIHSTVFSGQAMVASLERYESDPSRPKDPGRLVPVHAVFEYPELSEVASGGGIQGSILKSKMHEVLDHKSEIQYRSQNAGVVRAVNPFASIMTTTQTKRIKDLLKKDDTSSGFMNRFLFLMGSPRKQLARGKIALDFTLADEKLAEIDEYAQTPRVLDWTDEADAYWEKVHDEVIVPLKEADTQDILTRLDLNIKRMILVFAVNERAGFIDRHHVEMAEALIPYLVKCYEAVIGALLSTANREMSDWLMTKIHDLEKKALAKKVDPASAGPTQPELKRYYKHKHDWDDWKVTRAIKELIEAGLVVAKEAQGKRGQTTTRYFVLDAES